MKKIRFSTLIAALLTLSMLAAGCNNNNVPADTTSGDTTPDVSGSTTASVENTTAPTDDTTVPAAEPLSFVKDGKTDFVIVYRSGDDTVRTMAQQMANTFLNYSNVSIKLKSDAVGASEDHSSEHEILIGETNRAESAEFMADMAINQYGFGVRGNKLVIFGWNLTSLSSAIDSFTTYFKLNYSTKSQALELAGDLVQLKKEYTWRVDIPAFTAGRLTGTTDCNDNNLLWYYTDTSLSDFEAYESTLAASGYERVYENSITDNRFICYKSAAKDTVIYVSFSPCNGVTRLVSAPLSETNFVEDEEYTPITNIKVTQMILDYTGGKNIGMCYIVTLEDGSFLIYDSGGNVNGDFDRLYNLLNTLNERPDGKIVISAWLLTHEHWDHYANLYDFCRKYGSKVEVKYFLCNTPSYATVMNSDEPHYFMAEKYQAASQAVGGFKPVKLHTGEPVRLKGLELEVLYTQEDMYPDPIAKFNNTSMVTRIKAGGQTVMILGDILKEGCKIMIDRFGDYLKSDIMQVAHHGYVAASVEFYKHVDPSVILWPNSEEKAVQLASASSTLSEYYQNYYLVNKLNVLEIFYADGRNVTLSLPYTPNRGNEIYN